MSRDRATLARECQRIDGRGYPAYKDLRGAFAFEGFTLFIDHVQGDPFAAPSKVRVRVPMQEADFPVRWIEDRVCRLAVEDFVARAIRDAIVAEPGDRSGSGKSGVIRIDAGAQEVLERSAVKLTGGWIEARLEVGLPAAGRRVLGRKAESLLCETLPRIAHASLLRASLDEDSLTDFVSSIENQEAIRAQLEDRELVAFVANGSRLPRETGASDRPLEGADVVAFESPEAFEVVFEVPNPIDENGGREIRGMGISTGTTLIVGGGYHGKSTLLKAIERAVYPHVPGDGREYVVSHPGLVKIRAEDGRRIERTGIHAFIGSLPGGRSTRDFSTEDASGSTSQAASIIEAVEVGAAGLLLDEDTCATNFMLRDARMQALIHRDHEPITPFVDRVAELHERLGVSTVLVMGGCGDYFEAADQVIAMRDYRAHDVTADARKIAEANPGERQREVEAPFEVPNARVPAARSFDASRGKRAVKIDVRGVDHLGFGREDVNLRGVEQLLDTSQTRAIGLAMHFAARKLMGQGRDLRSVLDALDEHFDRESLDFLDPFARGDEHPGNLARPRRYEIAAAINRLRTLRVDSQ
ncbi:MAG: ABC-ATPase domain-containing protein [Myxococcota bacterium]|jgi:predicted ABC-class ATPase|nr:ABC-ATPase domain-containing protein [Myxococcota bacterium]